MHNNIKQDVVGLGKSHNMHQEQPEIETESVDQFDFTSFEFDEEPKDDDQSVACPLIQESAPKIAKKDDCLPTRTSARRGQKLRTNKNGVPLATQKELAQDIEDLFKGITNFAKEPYSIAKLCDTKEDTYGKKGSQLRQHVRDKLKHWKRLPQDEYQDILSSLGVWTAAQRNEQDTLNTLLSSKVSASPTKQQQRKVAAKLPSRKVGSHQIERAQQFVPRKQERPLLKDTKKEILRLHPTMSNSLGDAIQVTLPNGIIFVALWVDIKLHPSTLETLVSQDGMSVMQRTKKPSPRNAKELLSHYSWAKDPMNVVVNSVDAELKKLKKATVTATEWKETDIILLEEEVIRQFVDIYGNATNEIGYKTDSDGRQMITFFLKTLRAHEVAPTAAKFTNSGATSSPNGMDVGEDGEFDDEASDEDVRSEMNDRFDEMSKNLENHMNNMFNKFFEHMQQRAPPVPGPILGQPHPGQPLSPSQAFHDARPDQPMSGEY